MSHRPYISRITGAFPSAVALLQALLLTSPLAAAQDIAGAEDHPMVSRYPGQSLRWQHIENHRSFRIHTGPVSGYQKIDDFIDAEGQVTRSYYAYRGTDRSWNEIYLNYRDALGAAGFEILAQGASEDRRGPAVGSRPWLNVYLAANPPGTDGEVNLIAAGTATQGGQGTLVALRDRAAGRVYTVITVEQHAEDYVASLIDVVELKAADTGRVVIDPEAIGRDLLDRGRVVLDGLFFDFNQPTLTAESMPALQAIASFLDAHPTQRFYVVGHTDSRGSIEYNLRLSGQRARHVVDRLVEDYGVARERLEGHGVGPLNPMFSNASDDGREANRRVELVERLE